MTLFKSCCGRDQNNEDVEEYVGWRKWVMLIGIATSPWATPLWTGNRRESFGYFRRMRIRTRTMDSSNESGYWEWTLTKGFDSICWRDESRLRILYDWLFYCNELNWLLMSSFRHLDPLLLLLLADVDEEERKKAIRIMILLHQLNDILWCPMIPPFILMLQLLFSEAETYFVNPSYSSVI